MTWIPGNKEQDWERESSRAGIITGTRPMTGDLISALFLFIGNVGHMGVLSYKVLKLTELEVSFCGRLPSHVWPQVNLRPCCLCIASAFVSTG